ncbi:hypothetical protein HEP87_59105 [Streptomyces sp. S1D4-11]
MPVSGTGPGDLRLRRVDLRLRARFYLMMLGGKSRKPQKQG